MLLRFFIIVLSLMFFKVTVFADEFVVNLNFEVDTAVDYKLMYRAKNSACYKVTKKSSVQKAFERIILGIDDISSVMQKHPVTVFDHTSQVKKAHHITLPKETRASISEDLQGAGCEAQENFVLDRVDFFFVDPVTKIEKGFTARVKAVDDKFILTSPISGHTLQCFYTPAEADFDDRGFKCITISESEVKSLKEIDVTFEFRFEYKIGQANALYEIKTPAGGTISVYDSFQTIMAAFADRIVVFDGDIIDGLSRSNLRVDKFESITKALDGASGLPHIDNKVEYFVWAYTESSKKSKREYLLVIPDIQQVKRRADDILKFAGCPTDVRTLLLAFKTPKTWNSRKVAWSRQVEKIASSCF